MLAYVLHYFLVWFENLNIAHLLCSMCEVPLSLLGSGSVECHLCQFVHQLQIIRLYWAWLLSFFVYNCLDRRKSVVSCSENHGLLQQHGHTRQLSQLKENPWVHHQCTIGFSRFTGYKKYSATRIIWVEYARFKQGWQFYPWVRVPAGIVPA
jgi:LSD1 subclass zinc finger protein